jgi:hypothetical protein
MLGFAIKKAFFDLWDNLFFSMAVNLCYTLVSLGLYSLLWVFVGGNLTTGELFFPIPALITAVLGGVASFWARDIAVSGAGRFSEVLSRLKESWKGSLVFGIAWLVILAGFLHGIPFYSQLNTIVGFVFGIIMMWAVFFLAGAGLFYPGLNAQVEKRIGKLFVKSVRVFIAFPLTSLVMALVFLLCVALSVATFGFFPGIVGTSLWLQVCFKFVLAKLEWLEANPEADRKHVPWRVILQEDMDKVGPRSLKGLIFPWKD